VEVAVLPQRIVAVHGVDGLEPVPLGEAHEP